MAHMDVEITDRRSQGLVMLSNDAYQLYLFTRQYAGWTSFAPDARTKRAVSRLAILGLIEVNRYGQLRARLMD